MAEREHRDARVAVAIMVAGLLLAGGSWVLYSTTGLPFAVETSPHPGCGPMITFNVTGAPGSWNYTVTHAERGPHRIDAVRYRLTTDGGELNGTLRNASEAGGENRVRYVDNTGSGDVVDPGDALVLAADEMHGLWLYNASGALVGGTWACM